jgi:hypothetical protein
MADANYTQPTNIALPGTTLSSTTDYGATDRMPRTTSRMLIYIHGERLTCAYQMPCKAQRPSEWMAFVLVFLVGREWLEHSTYGLRVRCSTN